MSRNNSNENNVYGMSVTDWVNQRDVASNTVDNIRGCSSVNMLCAVRLSTCHLLDSQATNPQVSTHCITMSEVGGSTFQAQNMFTLEHPLILSTVLLATSRWLTQSVTLIPYTLFSLLLFLDIFYLHYLMYCSSIN
jgi:hypothetical protein